MMPFDERGWLATHLSLIKNANNGHPPSKKGAQSGKAERSKDLATNETNRQISALVRTFRGSMEAMFTEEASVRYLSSDEALKSLDRNLYWPKWDSPWWHMSLVHELGKTKRIPQEIITKMIEKLNDMPQKIFPVRGEGSTTDPYACHCMIGNMFQILWAWGVDIDDELPWMRPFLLKYQMSDGGLSCDHQAYAITEECPSSMVGTIAVFEAILTCVSRPHTAEEIQFLNKAANFLIQRELVQGSSSSFNAEEVESAAAWGDLCFPRFYFYDHLRGLRALLQIGLRPSALISSNQRVRFEDICAVSAENLTPTPLISMSLSNFDIGELTKVQTSSSSAGIEKTSSGVKNGEES